MNLSSAAFKLTVPVVLALIAFLIVTAEASTASARGVKPSGLEAELCDNSVCLSWTPGSHEFAYQQVLSWEGANPFDRYYGKRNTIGPHTAQAQVSLDSLNLEPAANNGQTVTYSFQVVGVDISGREGGPANHYSNQVTLHLPRPVIEPTVHREAPTGLSAGLCGEAVCLSWTKGAGDFTYQEIRYWKTGDPHNIWYGGGWIVNPRYSEFEYQIANLTHDASDGGDVSYTFQVLAVTRHMGKKVYIGESNTVVQVVPAHLMELAISR